MHRRLFYYLARRRWVTPPPPAGQLRCRPNRSLNRPQRWRRVRSRGHLAVARNTAPREFRNRFCGPSTSTDTPTFGGATALPTKPLFKSPSKSEASLLPRPSGRIVRRNTAPREFRNRFRGPSSAPTDAPTDAPIEAPVAHCERARMRARQAGAIDLALNYHPLSHMRERPGRFIM